jgi:hypothetical protein
LSKGGHQPGEHKGGSDELTWFKLYFGCAHGFLGKAMLHYEAVGVFYSTDVLIRRNLKVLGKLYAH